MFYGIIHSRLQATEYTSIFFMMNMFNRKGIVIEINEIDFFGNSNGNMKYNFIVFKNRECIVETVRGKKLFLLSLN